MDHNRSFDQIVELLSEELQGIVASHQIQEVLKAMERHGYSSIVQHDVSRAQELIERLKRPNLQVTELLQIWQARVLGAAEWSVPAPYAILAKRLVDLGVPFTAREVAEAGVGIASGQTKLELQQLLGLALERCGLVEDASKIFSDPEVAKLPWTEEMRGLEAALQKQLGLKASNPSSRVLHLRKSLRLYEAAWQASDGTFWTGINVAFLHFMLRDEIRAREVAKEIEADCLQEHEKLLQLPGADPYWLWATLGEAKLIQGDIASAEKWYRQAASQAGGRVGHLNSSRRQLRILFRQMNLDESLVDQWLPIPGVVVIKGPKNSSNRFNELFAPETESKFKAEVLQWLEQQNVRSCVCSASNGLEILFLETMQSLVGSDCRIVLPFPEADFVEECVKSGASENWVPRFQKVLAGASRVTIASSERMGNDDSPFEYAKRIALGQARMLASELQTGLIELETEGNESVFASLTSNSSHSALHASSISTASSIAAKIGSSETALKSMLFADVEGFSKLPDRQVRLFIEHFLESIASCVRAYAPQFAELPSQWERTSVQVRETWGDGLYFAMDDLRTAGCFALDLCDIVRQTDWQSEFGFDSQLKIRIALHTGPVHLGVDPITHLPKCTGTHVSRAARLEPKTPPNHVYASDAFASLAAEEGVTEFKCEFVKMLDWAKHYGSYPTYVVNRC